MIFDEMVCEEPLIPGDALIRRVQEVLSSLLRICRRMDADLVPERNRLSSRCLQINTFKFDLQCRVREIAGPATLRILSHVRSMRIAHRRIRRLPNVHD